MKFVLQVNSGPYSSNAGLSAYRFAQAALQAEHQVLRIFFYQDGIYHAFGAASPPDDELNQGQLWSQLVEQYGVDLVVCISAAQRRGLLCGDELKRRGQIDNQLAAGFRIAGLGQWLEASLLADRCIVFG